MALVALEDAGRRSGSTSPKASRPRTPARPSVRQRSPARRLFHVLSDDGFGAMRPMARAVQAEAGDRADPEVLPRVAAIWFAAGRAAEAEQVFQRLLAQFARRVAAAEKSAWPWRPPSARDYTRLAEQALAPRNQARPGPPGGAFLQLAQVYALHGPSAPRPARAADRAVALGASAFAQAEPAARRRQSRRT